MKTMEQMDCILCNPYECTCHFFSTNPMFLQQGISPPRELLDGNPPNQRMSLKGNSSSPFPSPVPQNKRSPGFQGDLNFNQGFPQHHNYFPNARIGRVEAFTASQVNF